MKVEGTSPDEGIYPRGFSSARKWHWPLVQSEKLVVLNYGKALRDGDRQSGNVPVYGTNGRCGWHDKPLTTGPGVILGRKGQGPLGVEWCDSDFWVIDTAYFVTRKTEQLDLRYFYYLVKYIGLNHLKDGTSNPSLSRPTFYDLLLPVPPLHTQCAISRFLATLDERIDLNRRMNETLEAIAGAIFISWFVDFGPVRTKMERRKVPAISSYIAQLFPSTLRDSVVGEIPLGWNSTRLSSQIDILSGGTPKTTQPEYWNGRVPWISVADTAPGPYITRTEKTITNAGLEQSATQLLPKETIIITARGTVGNTALTAEAMAMNQSCYGLRGRGQIGQLFLLYQVRQQLAILRANAHGSVFETITRSTFDSIEVVQPPDGLLLAYEQLARPLFDRILLNQRQNETLTDLRDALLPKLVSGEIRLGQAEMAIEARS
jgi:type I restriction enzyme S subunit